MSDVWGYLVESLTWSFLYGVLGAVSVQTVVDRVIGHPQRGRRHRRDNP